MNVPDRFDAFLFRRLPARELHGIRVAACLDSREEQERAFAKLAQALDLISSYSPGRFARLRRHARGILIVGPLGSAGEWKQSLGLVYLCRQVVLSEERTALELAGTLIHEATHAWLFHLGIGYEPPLRARVEAICNRAVEVLTRRAPGGEKLRDEREWQDTLPAGFWSTDSLRRRTIWQLRKLDAPAWVERLVLARYRLSPGLTVALSPDPCAEVRWDPEKQGYVWSYVTEVRNDTDVPLQIDEFWPSVRHRFRWRRAEDRDDPPLGAAEFDRAFGTENGWIPPRSMVRSSKLFSWCEEYGAWRMRWTYLATDVAGNCYYGCGIVRLSRVPAAVRRPPAATRED
ncbi:MAG: hypothetical protein ACK47B_21000 [Armatimonadota bacterium]